VFVALQNDVKYVSNYLSKKRFNLRLLNLSAFVRQSIPRLVSSLKHVLVVIGLGSQNCYTIFSLEILKTFVFVAAWNNSSLVMGGFFNHVS
jgi:predicted membrane protein